MANADGGFMKSWFQPRGISVFVFHSVESSPKESGGSWVSSAQSFRDQLDFIDEQFEVLTISEALRSRGKASSNRSRACITFDDGDPSWMGLVRAELAQRRLRATFYVATNQITEQPIWHDRLSFCLNSLQSSCIDLPWLGVRRVVCTTATEKLKLFEYIVRLFKYQAPEVRERMLARLESSIGAKCPSSGLTAADLNLLISDGHEIGSHTKSHPILSNCSDEISLREIAESREILRQAIGCDVTSFSYPNGKPGLDYLAKHVDMVRRAGYESAVSTAHGGFSDRTSVWEIPRFTPWGVTPFSKRRQIFFNSWSTPKFAERSKAKNDRVLFVENGTGFGGAVVALQSLLERIPEDRAVIGVVSGGRYKLGNIKSVKNIFLASSHPGASDQKIINILRRSAKRWGALSRMIEGRYDDLFVRLPYLIKLLLAVLRFRPDMIHGNNEIISNREAMLVARLLRIPYIQHVRGPFPEGARLGYLIGGPSLYLAVSRWLYFDCAERGVELNKLMQVYDGIATVTFQPSQNTCLHSPSGDGATKRAPVSQAVVVAMVGMLVPWKGQEIFIEAVSRICRRHPEARFLIVGSQPNLIKSDFQDILLRQAEGLGVSDRINFTGQLPDLAQKMAEFDVVVSASVAPEPLGLVMIEALQNGCYFVGPNHGATAEFIDDEDKGILFESGAVNSLAEALESAIGRVLARRAAGTPAQFFMPPETSLDMHVSRVLAIQEGVSINV